MGEMFRFGSPPRRSKDEGKLVDLEVFLHHQTKHAYLVSTSGLEHEAVWIPKSQCELDKDVLTLPEWLATQRGLV